MAAFIDAHHHFWDVERNHYPWLAEADHDRGWGDWSALRNNYLPEHLLADAAGLQLLKSVHVQANWNPADPLGETRWLHEVAADPASRGFPHAVVAFADLSASDAAATLDAHQRYPLVRGIRQVLNRHTDPKLNRAPKDFLSDPTWRKNLGLLASRGLSFDAQIYQHQAPALAELARTYPDLRIVMDHAMMPAERDPLSLEGWRRGVTLLSRAPNVAMKLSGFGMVDLDWTPESIRPFALHCIESFGPERCMFGSNFPVDRLMSSYLRLWESYEDIASSFTPVERDAMFRRTAECFYRL